MASLNEQSFGSAMGVEGGGEQGLELGGYGFLAPSSRMPVAAVASRDQVSLGPSSALSSSQYLRKRYAQAYAEPVRISQPRPRTTPTVPAPGEAPNSVGAYYRKKFAAFYDPNTSWATFAPPTPAVPPKETITGTTHITIEDLLMLIQVVSTETIKVENLRSTNPDTLIKVHDMKVLVGDLQTLSGKLDRRELREYQIPIRASVARNFLTTFRGAIALPPLIDSVALPPVQNIPTLPQGSAATAPPPKRGPDIVVLFQDVQQTRWNLEASLDPSVAHYSDMLNRLNNMERRIVSYATSDTPMPADLQLEFEDEIRRLQGTFRKVANIEPDEGQ